VAQVIYKVYDESDVFLGVLDDVVSELSIPNSINSLGMSIEVELGRNADSQSFQLEPYLDSDGVPYEDSSGFSYSSITTPKNKVGPGSLINHNYRVDIVTSAQEDLPYNDSDDDTYDDSAGNPYISVSGGSGAVKFTGFISNIRLNYGAEENVVITITSFGFDLDQYLVESGGDTRVAFNSYDPSDILKDGLDAFTVASGSPITYDVSSIDDTSTTVSYTFNTNTYKELVEKVIELAPSDWYYFLDPGSNLVYLKERPTTVDHYFYLGKHIEKLDLESSILSSFNDSVFSGGEDPLNPGENIYVRYTETPASNTRRVLQVSSDNRVTTESGGTLIATGEVERNNQIIYTTKISILAATYDINTIQVGQLIGFRNFDNYVDAIELQIVKTNYQEDRIVLDVGTLLPSVNKRLEDLRRNLILQETERNPDAPA